MDDDDDDDWSDGDDCGGGGMRLLTSLRTFGSIAFLSAERVRGDVRRENGNEREIHCEGSLCVGKSDISLLY